MDIKFKTIDDALNLIKDNDYIVTGLAASEPRLLLQNLHKIANRINKVTIANCLFGVETEFMNNPIYEEKFHMDSWFHSPMIRRAVNQKNIHYVPNHLHVCAKKKIFHASPTVYAGVCSMPDKHGYVSLGFSNTYEMRIIEQARTIILEANPNIPRVHGDHFLHVNQVDCLVRADYVPPGVPYLEPTEKDIKIGNFIAQYINDGDCIQLGIGGIPNAVVKALLNKKHLGVHTEMITPGIYKLVEAGAVDGSKKQVHKGQIVATMIYGDEALYKFVDDNPAVLILDGATVNEPTNIAKNDNQKSINTTIEIDLTGQCASESIGAKIYSGTGGQADTAIGAQKSKNGISFIALYSTAFVRNENGEKEEISKIVPVLNPGAGVTLSRNDVDMVVTEYGIVSLRGTNIKERVERLISIAHPKFRKQLYDDAVKYNLIR